MIEQKVKYFIQQEERRDEKKGEVKGNLERINEGIIETPGARRKKINCE